MTKIFDTCEHRTPLVPSTYGYWILPSGAVLSMREGMRHGDIVQEYVKGTSDESALDGAIAYERSQDPDVKKSTLADLFACRNLGWIRINISQYSDAFMVSWSAKPSLYAKESLRMILDEHDTMDEDIETDYGSVRGWIGLNNKLDNPIYWRHAA